MSETFPRPMKPSKWPDFVFALAVRLFCGVLLGCLLCLVLGYRGILRSFSHNHVRAVWVWFGLWGFIGGLVSVFTVPRWQTPWYRGIRSPSVWKDLTPGMRRQEIVDRLVQPSDHSAAGEDVWREGNWEAVGVVR